MLPRKIKRKHQKSGNNSGTKTKISPENKKQKSMLHYVDCSKGEITDSMAEMLESQTLNSGQNSQEKSVIEAKLDEILDKIKPIDEIRTNVKVLTDNFLKLEKTAENHEARILNIEQNVETNDKILQSIQADVRRLDGENAERKGRHDMNSLWKAKCESLEESLSRMEAYSRRENVIFEGIGETDGENCEDVIHKLLVKRMLIQDAREKIRFTAFHRIGKKKAATYARAANNAVGPRPIIARVAVYAHKEEIMSRRRFLSTNTEESSAVQARKIWINHDYPENVRKARRTLAPVLKMAKQRDQNSYLSGDKLHYKGQLFSLYELGRLDFDVTSLSMDRRENYIAFYGRFCPLSNFFPVAFVIDGVTYSCSEQFYQEQKAKFALRRDIAEQILLAKDPAMMKRLGDQIKITDSAWQESQAVNVMRKGLEVKFSNPFLKSFLQQTQQKTLIEANKFDKYWSSRVSAKDPRINNNHSWQGKNTIGELLMDLRSRL